MKNITIVGASLAGTSAAKALREDGYDGHITIVGEETCRPYDRPPLSKDILVGSKTVDEIALRDLDDLDIDWELGTPATGLDLGQRRVRTDSGGIPFEGLVIATGVRARVLAGFEPDGERVLTLRSLDDALRLRVSLLSGNRVLIVGNGFIGIEVATSARSLGCDVTTVGLFEPLGAAGPIVSATCARFLARDGITSIVGRRVVSMDRERGTAHLDDGRVLEFDVMVVAIGSVPNVEWFAGSGLAIEDGVLCDERCSVIGGNGVVAAGDIARWPNPAFDGRSMRIEHWANAVEQGAAAARTLLHGEQAPGFASLPSFWSEHCGVRLQSVGLPLLGDRIEFTDGAIDAEKYAVASYLDDQLIGGQTYGIPRAMAHLRVRMSREMKREQAA